MVEKKTIVIAGFRETARAYINTHNVLNAEIGSLVDTSGVPAILPGCVEKIVVVGLIRALDDSKIAVLNNLSVIKMYQKLDVKVEVIL